MVCRGCGNESAYALRKVGDYEECNQCGGVSTVHVPDVYVDGKPEINLADDPATGKPRVFTSRLAKERYLRDRKLVEVRDKHHGGPSLPSAEPAYNAQASKHETMKALQHVRQMGRDQRRQEYFRIVKETRDNANQRSR